MRKAKYSVGNVHQVVELVRKCRLNTRIRFPDGQTQVVANDTLSELPEERNNTDAKRIIPQTPLELLYRKMRAFEGSRIEKFHSLQSLLGGRHGATGSSFIAELFRRSMSATGFYSNPNEGFYSDRPTKDNGLSTFAPSFVSWVSNNTTVKLSGKRYRFVDFEIYPFRTTRSCKESGAAATYGNAGGIDLLLATTAQGHTVPVVVEVKAMTETVGPTFALIQSLMYSTQLLSRSQFERLAVQYDEFRSLNIESPSLEIIVVLEQSATMHEPDLVYAKALADGVLSECRASVREISFLKAAANDDGFSIESLSGNSFTL